MPQVDTLKGSVALPHVEGTLEEVRKRTALDLGAPRIPAVAWKDVGGLEHVKKAILETIELPLKYRCACCACCACRECQDKPVQRGNGSLPGACDRLPDATRRRVRWSHRAELFAFTLHAS